MQPLPIEKIKELFNQRLEINTVLVFGSFVKDRVQKSSDIDFAILLHPDQLPKNIFDYSAKLGICLEEICGRETDILILNTSSPHIAFRAVKEGEVIYQHSNHSFWNSFVVKTISMNEDMEILYRKIKHG